MTTDLDDINEKLVQMNNVQTQLLTHISVIAENGRQNVWTNRVLILAMIVLAGANEVLKVTG